MTKEHIYAETVLREEENIRLDKFLLKKHTEMHSESHSETIFNACSKTHTKHGLRYFRRLCDENMVLVNAKVKPAHYKVQAHDSILLYSLKIGNEEKKLHNVELLCAKLHNVEIHKNENYTSFYKPKNMHSATIQGKNSHAFELSIPYLLPNFPDAVLLNRLDFLTSGILVLALNKEAKEKFLLHEKNGEIEKKYFAIVKGHVKEVFTIKNALNTDNRKKTKVLSELAVNNRWTHIKPLEYHEGISLVLASIKCGARHQIRAHLASVGFPIIYDPLYSLDNEQTNKQYSACTNKQTDKYTRSHAHKNNLKIDHTAKSIGCNEDEIVIVNEINDNIVGKTADEKFLTESTTNELRTERLFLHHAYIAFADFTATNLPTWEHAYFSSAHFDYKQYL